MTKQQVVDKAIKDAKIGVSLMDGDQGIYSQEYYEAYMIAGGWV